LRPPGPLDGLRGCDPGKREIGEKERGRGTEDRRKRVEGRIGKWEGKGREGKQHLPRLRLSSGCTPAGIKR